MCPPMSTHVHPPWRCVFPNKSHRYDEVSPDHRCVDCGKPIKKRLVQQKRLPPKRCYACWTAKRGVRPQRK